MAEIADTLRAALADLDQAGARLNSGLAEELGESTSVVEEPRALMQPEGGALATEQSLMRIGKEELLELCGQR
jgi:hypothetical protein